MVLEYNVLETAIFTKVCTRMASHMVPVNIIGQTKAISKVTLRMAYVVAKAFGKDQLATVINMMVNTKMIRNGGMEYLLGPLAISIKGNIGLITDMGTVKCIGQKEIGIKETGRMDFKVGKVIVILI